MKTLITLLLSVILANAATINFASEGSALDANEYQSFGNTVAIDPHPAWASPLPGSLWVSYRVTGNPDTLGYVAPPNGLVVSFYDFFTLPWIPETAYVTVMADDSAAVYVNGNLAMAEAPPNSYTACSNVPIGCLAATAATIDILAYLQAGENILRFDVAQRNSVSFGLDYAGAVTESTSTPEPTSVLMVSLGFICVGLGRWLTSHLRT